MINSLQESFNDLLFNEAWIVVGVEITVGCLPNHFLLNFLCAAILNFYDVISLAKFEVWMIHTHSFFFFFFNFLVQDALDWKVFLKT